MANHTSPIDVVILSVDRPYALVGQSHGGMMGLIQASLSRGAAHIWFQRSETKDRSKVTRRSEHTQPHCELTGGVNEVSPLQLTHCGHH